MNTEIISSAEVVQANIDLHTALSETYNAEQPHYRPENKGLVSARLASLAARVGNNTLIDFGCGTGFIIHLAVPYFKTVFGVDITPAMMSKVDLTSGKVRLLQSNTEKVPLDNECADVITANSFLHHLHDIQPTIAEAYRLLRNGGVFYSEEDPNRDFWQSIKRLGNADETIQSSYSELLKRERAAVIETHTEIGSLKNIEPKVVQIAEYRKMVLGGMAPKEVKTVFHEVGFSKVNIEYYWFLGQAKIMHGSLPEAAEQIEAYLRSVLPLSKHLFKYFRVEAWK